MTAVPKPEKRERGKKCTTTRVKKFPAMVLKKLCDGIWAKIVKALNPSCIWCGKRAAIHAHHIFTRSLIPTRHVILNGASLCGGCHMKAHQHAALFVEFIRKHLGPEIYENLMNLAYGPYTKTDYGDRFRALMSMATQLWARGKQISFTPKETKTYEAIETVAGGVVPAGGVPHQEAAEAVQTETAAKEGEPAATAVPC